LARELRRIERLGGLPHHGHYGLLLFVRVRADHVGAIYFLQVMLVDCVQVGAAVHNLVP